MLIILSEKPTAKKLGSYCPLASRIRVKMSLNNKRDKAHFTMIADWSDKSLVPDARLGSS